MMSACMAINSTLHTFAPLQDQAWSNDGFETRKNMNNRLTNA